MNVQRIAALGFAIALTSASHRAAATEPRQTQPREWTLREDLRLGDSAGTADDLRSLSVATVRSDGSISAFLRNGDVVVFDRSGLVRHRVHTLDDAAKRAEMREQAESSLARARAGLSHAGLVASHRVPTMGFVGDTLWASSESTRKITLIDERGRAARRLTYSASVEGYSSGTPLALLSDRSLLRTFTSDDGVARPLPAAPPPRPPEQYRMPVIPIPPVAEDEPPARSFLVRTSPDGRVLQGLEIFPAPRRTVTVRNPYGQVAPATNPFRDDPLIAATPDGSRIIYVERYTATKSASASYVIASFDAETGRRTGHHYEYVPVPVAAATVDSLLDPLLDSLNTPFRERFLEGFPSREAARSALRAALDPPPYHTPFTEVVVGADGIVWLRHRASERWDAHTRDGRVAGRVLLPRDARLVCADGSALWVAMPRAGGPRGADVLVRYRIIRP